MNSKFLIPVFATVLGSLFLLFGIARAQNPFSTVTFPIVELGSCANLQSCKSYCDVSEHVTACISFAQSHGLTHTLPPHVGVASSSVDALLVNGTGPGGCGSRGECKTYCEDVSHLQACMTFAKKHTLLSKTELAEGDKIVQAVKKGITTPGGCTTKDACAAYCQDSSHTQECIDFAKKAGTVGKDELARVATFQTLLASGAGPGGCTTANECKQYCQDQTHRDECVAFGAKAGFISKPEARRMLATSTRQGPGGCDSAQSCAAFCSNSVNHDTCIQFIQERGLKVETQGGHDQEDLQVGEATTSTPHPRSDDRFSSPRQNGQLLPRSNASTTREQYLNRGSQGRYGSTTDSRPAEIQRPPIPGGAGAREGELHRNPFQPASSTNMNSNPTTGSSGEDMPYTVIPPTLPASRTTSPPSGYGLPLPPIFTEPQSLLREISTMTANVLLAVSNAFFQYLVR